MRLAFLADPLKQLFFERLGISSLRADRGRARVTETAKAHLKLASHIDEDDVVEFSSQELDDAKLVGARQWSDCTLILTESDS